MATTSGSLILENLSQPSNTKLLSQMGQSCLVELLPYPIEGPKVPALPFEINERGEATNCNSPFFNNFGQGNPFPENSNLPRNREL
jgi:hypothetical protein